jgi:hypothetical protein
MIIEMLGILDNDAIVGFVDVATNEWYYPYIATAKKIGLAKGISENEFGVGIKISRQDMATMLYRAVQLQNIELNNAEQIEFIDDDSIADYAKEAVNIMQKSQIINGFEDGSFRPNDIASKAQAAKIIYTLLQQI